MEGTQVTALFVGMSGAAEHLQVYLRVIESNLQARRKEPGYGGETEEVSRKGSSTPSLSLLSPALSVHSVHTLHHSKQQSLPCLRPNSSPFLDQSSEVPSFDEAPTSYPSPSLQPDFRLSPMSLQSQADTEARTSAASLDPPSDFKAVRVQYTAQMRSSRSQVGVLPTTTYCSQCQLDVSTRVSVELPGYTCLESWSCCTDLAAPRYQDVRHYCRTCRALLVAFQPD